MDKEKKNKSKDEKINIQVTFAKDGKSFQDIVEMILINKIIKK